MIGLLNAYRYDPDADYQKQYGPMCLEFLSRALPGEKVKMYEVALGDKPKSDDECDAWIITGSPKAAYGSERWIHELGQFIINAHHDKRKMIGICFGHQMIAHHLGGRTAQSPAGWGVGVRSFRVLKHKPWMQPRLDEVSLLFSHQDQVVELPPRAEHLASDEFCKYQMFSIGEHIFCLQGHPEFTPEFAKGRLDTRVESVGREKYERAVQSMGRKTHSEELGSWIRAFVLGNTP